MKKNDTRNIISDALAVEAEEAKRAGKVGYKKTAHRHLWITFIVTISCAETVSALGLTTCLYYKQ